MTDSAPPEGASLPDPVARPAASRSVKFLGQLKRVRGPIAAIAGIGAILSGLVGYWTAYEKDGRGHSPRPLVFCVERLLLKSATGRCGSIVAARECLCSTAKTRHYLQAVRTVCAAVEGLCWLPGYELNRADETPPFHRLKQEHLHRFLDRGPALDVVRSRAQCMNAHL